MAAGISSDAQLKRKLDEVLQKHKNELSLCLDSWLENEWAVLAKKASFNGAPDRGDHIDPHDGMSNPKLLTSQPWESSANMAGETCTCRQDLPDLPGASSKSPEASVPLEPEENTFHGVMNTFAEARRGTAEKITKNLHLKTPSPFIQKVENVVKNDEKLKERRLIKRKVSEILLEENRDVVKSKRNILQHITDSDHYELLSATLIIANSIFIGWQTQYFAERTRDSFETQDLPSRAFAEPAFLVISIVFTALFTIELGLRWAADGFREFFTTHDTGWNLMDIFIVLFAIVDSVLEATQAKNALHNNIALLRVLRIVRIVRIARIVRIMRFFKELRLMIFSILGSMKTMLWVILVLSLMLYVFGIGFTAASVGHLQEAVATGSSRAADLELSKYFGTLGLSFVSLFMAMSGGNDWGTYYDALEPLGWTYQLLWLFYISCSVIAVVNVVTGVFVDSAMQQNQTDREMIIHEELQTKQDYLQQMAGIFMEIDTDGTSYISRTEFERSLEDERVIAYFSAMKLDVSDACTLFSLLDVDHSDEVNINEFIAGCYKLQGESRSLDVKIMHYEIRFLSETLARVHDMLKNPPKAAESPAQLH